MEDRKKQLFDEHLPYELEMFEEAARFLMSDECAKLDRENNKDDWFRANAAVEAFWNSRTDVEGILYAAEEPRTGTRRTSRLSTRLRT